MTYANFRPLIKRRIQRESVDFFKNLALMSESGIPLNEALQVLIAQARTKTFREFLTSVKRQVEQGSALAKAIQPYQPYLGDLVVNVIRAGEINGTLEQNFRYLADLLERRRVLDERISAALLYPKIVMALALAVGGGVSAFLFPKLIPLFQALNVELPLATRILLVVAELLANHGVAFLLGLTAAVALFIVVIQLRPVRWAYHTVILRLPVLGNLVKAEQLALFSAVFGALYRSGLSIREALQATAEAMTNVRYRQALMVANRRLATGIPLATLLAKRPFYFPQNLVALIGVGESSGKLDESFAYLAKFYDAQIETKTKQLPTVLEPIMLVLIGCVVAFIAIAIISPIYEITKGIQPGGASTR